jgi:parallel beta-helix repeat protein
MAHCSTYNCRIVNNTAETGGGAYYGILRNCVVAGNSAQVGGGTSVGSINNCTVSGNHASRNAGGVYGTAVRNSIVYDNTAPANNNGDGFDTGYSCMMPLPAGAANIIQNVINNC